MIKKGKIVKYIGPDLVTYQNGHYYPVVGYDEELDMFSVLSEIEDEAYLLCADVLEEIEEPEDITVLQYYRVKDTGIVAKGDGMHFWIYIYGKWQFDTAHYISDLVMGYDPSEPKGSSYGFGNTSVMDAIEKISYDEAMMYISRAKKE